MLITIPFPGLYETLLDSLLAYEVEQMAQQLDETDDVLAGSGADAIYAALNDAIDWGAAHRAVARAYAEAFADLASEVAGWPLRLVFESMHSPRFYNFETDRVFCEVRLDVLLRMRAETPESVMAAAVADLFRPRSGFIPFYSDDLRDWLAKPMDRWDHNEAGTLLIAFLTHKGGDRVLDELEQRVIDDLMDTAAFYKAVSDAFDIETIRERIAAEQEV